MLRYGSGLTNHHQRIVSLRRGIMSVELLKQFQNNPRLFQLADRLSLSQLSAGASSSQKIYLKNLRGSSPVFVNAAVFLHPACADLNHLVIVNDAEVAAY